MTEHNPIDLDSHRGMAAQKSTEVRRQLHDVEVDQAALKRRQEELETVMSAAPAQTWLEAADKACHLLKLYAATPEAQDPRRRKLIADVLADFERLRAGHVRPTPFSF